MSKKDKRKSERKKRKSDSDGVTVKRSYYSFSQYYPGGGSSQKYRRVMKETKDEKKPLKIAFAVLGLAVLVFIGYFFTTVCLEVSYAPTTEPTELVTETVSTTSKLTEISESETVHTTEKMTEPKTEGSTIEEPEREVNVTEVLHDVSAISDNSISDPE